MDPVPALAHPRVSFDIVVEDGFVLTELSGIVDVLRLANRVTQKEVFSWQYRSLTGGLRTSNSGAMIDTEVLPVRPLASYAVVLGNAETDALAVPMRHVLRLYGGRTTRLVLLAEAAAHYVQIKGSGPEHTTHWENRLALAEETDASDLGAQLACAHGGVTTCAGMEATVDLTLSLLQDHLSQSAIMNVADILLHDRIRDLRTPQPFSRPEVSSTGDADVDASIALMQANLEEPIPIHDLCSVLEISSRSLERKFNRHIGMTPYSYYRELRLNRASNLLLNTSLSIREVGLACGFSSGFSTLYKSVFGRTPAEARRQRLQSRMPVHPKGRAVSQRSVQIT